MKRTVEAAFATSSENDFEICFRRKNGRTGDVVQHFASFVDLSKHKDEEDRLRFLLGELPAAVRLTNCRASAGRPGSFHLEYIARQKTIPTMMTVIVMDAAEDHPL